MPRSLHSPGLKNTPALLQRSFPPNSADPELDSRHTPDLRASAGLGTSTHSWRNGTMATEFYHPGLRGVIAGETGHLFAG